MSDLIFDYNHRNLYKKNRVKISFPLNTMYNTVQGWHSKTSISFYKDKEHQNLFLNGNIDYGFSDKQLRAEGLFSYRFNDKANSILSIKTGRVITEFNDPYSTSPLFNTLSTLIFEENNAKFYDKYFTSFSFKEEVINGLLLKAKLSYERRIPLYNTSKVTLFDWKDTAYTANNPLNPNNFNESIIEKHNLFKLSINTILSIGQKYKILPHKKVHIESHYPKLKINYTKGISNKDSNYNFDYFEAGLFQRFNINNKGLFIYNIKSGLFLNQKQLSFVDYKHFDITQAHVSLVKDYTNYFALLSAYSYSTNNKYVEFHIEHQFDGFLLQKIPLINRDFNIN